MDNPIYPPEWRNLRLELKDDDEITKEEKNKTDKIKPVSILKNPNEKISDFDNKKDNKKYFKFCNCM